MTNNDLIKVLILLGGINVLIVLAYLMKKIKGMPGSIPRKFLHITAITIAGYSFVYISDSAYLLALGILILLGNYVMYKKEVFEKNKTGEKNLGIFFVPISYLILVLTMNEHRELAMFSMFIMAFADAGAALIGEFFPLAPYTLGSSRKTLSGSLTFAFVTLLLLNLSLFFTVDGKIFMSVEPVFKIWIFLLFTTLILTVAEALSTKGFDNIIVPLLSAYFFILFFTHPFSVSPEGLFYGVLLAGALLYFSFKYKFLTPDGAYAAFILGAVIFGFGGLKWSVPLLTFFILSSLLSKIKKNNFSDAFEKGDNRDALQVLANGGLPAILLGINLIHPDAIWFVLYLISLAVSMADTWATEIGNIKKRHTFWILNLKPVSQGVSGGISLGGTIGGITGAAVLTLSGIAWIRYYPLLIFFLVATGGAVGMFIDSILGATLQRKNRCSVCGKETEKRVHCGKPTRFSSGIKFINNDMVNFLSALTVVVITYFILR